MMGGKEIHQDDWSAGLMEPFPETGKTRRTGQSQTEELVLFCTF